MALAGSPSVAPPPVPRPPSGPPATTGALRASQACAIAPPRVARTRPWERVRALRDTLDPALARIAAGAPGAAEALDIVRAACAELQRPCALDPDALLALPLRPDGACHGTRHAMSAAVVLEFMLARRGAGGTALPEAVRRTTSDPRRRIEATVRPEALGLAIDPVELWEAAEVIEDGAAGH